MENVLVDLPYTFVVVVVNDCSTDDTQSQLEAFGFNAPTVSLKIIALNTNSGHQAAIYQGLLFSTTLACNEFIIMDSDGQDAPEVITELLLHRGSEIIHVIRGKRNESVLFRACYYFYRLLFKLFTGKQMNYGNFCLISRNVLETAIAAQFKHFPAFLAKQKLSKRYVIAPREKRLGGRSKMGFGKLINHALNSLSEYNSEMVTKPLN
jgi:glycosyltransferase involved in cell wall biosynthesis